MQLNWYRQNIINANQYYKIRRYQQNPFRCRQSFVHAYVYDSKRIDSHRHRRSCRVYWHLRIWVNDPEDLSPVIFERATDEGRRGFSRIDYGITFPRLAYRSPILHRGCIVHRRCHRRSRQNAPRKHLRALLPFHCRVDARCFTGSSLSLSPFSFPVFHQCIPNCTPCCRIPSGGPILSGCSPLCLPLVQAAVGSRWKCSLWCSRTKRVK